MSDILVILMIGGLFLIDDFRIQKLENRIRRLENKTNLLDLKSIKEDLLDELEYREIIKKFENITKEFRERMEDKNAL
ncbi:Hsp33 family molecular chaperone HslO [Clostridium botulinum]|nr:Hsp33 family molecular chaperone HslO [Clostridium botulinum]NFS95859.1 Hsp33 family molecular chaperone HslO [Clostridium botulinum]